MRIEARLFSHKVARAIFWVWAKPDLWQFVAGHHFSFLLQPTSLLPLYPQFLVTSFESKPENRSNQQSGIKQDFWFPGTCYSRWFRHTQLPLCPLYIVPIWPLTLSCYIWESKWALSNLPQFGESQTNGKLSRGRLASYIPFLCTTWETQSTRWPTLLYSSQLSIELTFQIIRSNWNFLGSKCLQSI